MQMLQFIPQGATRETLFKDSIVSPYLLFARAVPIVMFIAGIVRRLIYICTK